jgi:hypothetical protein
VPAVNGAARGIPDPHCTVKAIENFLGDDGGIFLHALDLIHDHGTASEMMNFFYR